MAKTTARGGYGWSLQIGATYTGSAVVAGTLTPAVIGATGATTTAPSMTGGTSFATVQDLSGGGLKIELDEVTNAASPNQFEEKIATLLQQKELKIKATYDATNYWLAEAVARAMVAVPIIVTFPDSSTISGTAFLSDTGDFSVSPKKHIEASFTLTNDSGGFVFAKKV